MDCDGDLRRIVRILCQFKSQFHTDLLNAFILQRWAPIRLLVIPAYHSQSTRFWKYRKQSFVGSRICRGLYSPMSCRILG